MSDLKNWARRQAAPGGKKPKLGTGKRSEELSTELGEKPGVEDPDALAAAVGRKKHGASKMAKWAAAGRK